MRLRRLFALLTLVPASMSAQELRGIVTLPDGATRAPGVILIASLDDGRAARTLSGPSGEYTLRLPAAGRYTVRALRIGFRPTEFAPTQIAEGEVRELRVLLRDEAVQLQRVTVRGRDQCGTSADSGLLVLKVWEETRKALLSSRLASTSAPLVAERHEYDRLFDSTGRYVRDQTVRATSGPTTQAFRSWNPDSLAERGYVISNGDELTFHGPDADVLLDPSFVARHCLRVEPPPEDAGDLVGVSFRPVAERERIADIEGTFWIDRASAELRWLEFTYTNIPDAMIKAGAGGRVEFLRLDTGNWLVSKWKIRMPRVEVVTQSDRAGRARVAVMSRGLSVRAIRESGGEVSAVFRRDTLVHRVDGPMVDVQVVSVDSLVPAAGAEVALLGTGYRATAGSSGGTIISNVVPGHYKLSVRPRLYDRVGAPSVEREIEVNSRVAPIDSMVLPSAAALTRIVCGAQRIDSMTLFYGVLRDARGEPVVGGTVSARWSADYGLATTATGSRFTANDSLRTTVTDLSARWHLCVASGARAVTVRGESVGAVAEVRQQTAAATPILDVPLTLASVVTDAAPADAARAIVEISVAARGGAPLPQTSLEVSAPGVPDRTVTTDGSGRVLVYDLPVGGVRIKVKRPGFRAGDIAVSVAAGANTVPITLDRAGMPLLDTVRVMGGKRVTGRLDEFETRRLRGETTASFSRSDIEKRNPVEISEMLRTVPAVNVLKDNYGRTMIFSTRGRYLSNGDYKPCVMPVVIDGVLLPADANIDERIRPDAVYGVEVFAGGARIPPQYNNLGGGVTEIRTCGLVMIWTR